MRESMSESCPEGASPELIQVLRQLALTNRQIAESVSEIEKSYGEEVRARAAERRELASERQEWKATQRRWEETAIKETNQREREGFKIPALPWPITLFWWLVCLVLGLAALLLSGYLVALVRGG
jgi:hypothetical protein